MNNYPSGYSEPPTWDEYFESQDAAIKNYVQKLEQRISDAESERDALKARIESAEKQEPFGYFQQKTYLPGGSRWEESNICESVPERGIIALYAAPILSPDTAEIIRKAVEEERGACAKICDDYSTNFGTGMFEEHSNDCADAIRSRSTKEK